MMSHPLHVQGQQQEQQRQQQQNDEQRASPRSNNEQDKEEPVVHRTQFLRRKTSLSNVDPSSAWMSLSLRNLQAQQEQQKDAQWDTTTDGNKSVPSSPQRPLQQQPTMDALASAMKVEERRRLWHSRTTNASSLALSTVSPPQSPSTRRAALGGAVVPVGSPVYHSPTRMPQNASLRDLPLSPGLSVKDRRKNYERAAGAVMSPQPPLIVQPQRNPYLSFRRSSSLSPVTKNAQASMPPTNQLPISPTISSSGSSSSMTTNSSNNAETHNASAASMNIESLPATSRGKSAHHNETRRQSVVVDEEEDDMCNSGEFSIDTHPTDGEDSAPCVASATLKKQVRDTVDEIMRGFDDQTSAEKTQDGEIVENFESLDVVDVKASQPVATAAAQAPQAQDDCLTSVGSESFDTWILHIDDAFDGMSFSSVSSGSYREPSRKQTSYRIRYNGPTTLDLDRFASSEDRFATGDGMIMPPPHRSGALSTTSGMSSGMPSDMAPSQPSRHSAGNDGSKRTSRSAQTRPDVWITPSRSPDPSHLSWRVRRVWKDLSPDMVQALPRRTRDNPDLPPDDDEKQEDAPADKDQSIASKPVEVPSLDGSKSYDIVEPLKDNYNFEYEDESSVQGSELFERIRSLVGAPVRNSPSGKTSSTVTPSTFDESYTSMSDALVSSNESCRDDAPKLPKRSWRMDKFFDEDGEWLEDEDDDLNDGVFANVKNGQLLDDAQFEAGVQKVHAVEEEHMQRDIRHEKRREEVAERNRRRRLEAPATPRRLSSPKRIPKSVGQSKDPSPDQVPQEIHLDADAKAKADFWGTNGSYNDIEIALKGSFDADDDDDDKTGDVTSDCVDSSHHDDDLQSTDDCRGKKSRSSKKTKKSKERRKAKKSHRNGKKKKRKDKSKDRSESQSPSDRSGTKTSAKACKLPTEQNASARRLLSPREVNLKFGGAVISDSSDSESEEEEQQQVQGFGFKKKKKRKKKMAPRNEHLVSPADVNRLTRSRHSVASADVLSDSSGSDSDSTFGHSSRDEQAQLQRVKSKRIVMCNNSPDKSPMSPVKPKSSRRIRLVALSQTEHSGDSLLPQQSAHGSSKKRVSHKHKSAAA